MFIGHHHFNFRPFLMTIISADQTSPSSLHNSISTFLILQSIFLKSSSSFNATSSTFGLTKIPWRFLILLNSRNSAIYSCRHLLQKYLDNIIFLLYRLVKLVSIVFFFYQGFPHRHWRFTGQQGKGGNHSFILLYHLHPLTNIETFICNFACEMTITYF